MVKSSSVLIATTVGIATVLLFAQACETKTWSSSQTNQIASVYNKKTGRLELLKYDSDGDGKFDTFSYMDGPTIVRIEIDKDEDGKIDRWEYYAPGKKLERIGLSRANNGIEDTWQYIDENGAVSRVEMAAVGAGKAANDARGNKRIERTEYFDRGALVRAEEDTDGDGAIDKWETYDGERLAVVAFDEAHRGHPTRRMVYAADGTVRVQIDPDGSGHFIEQPPSEPKTRRSQ